MVNPANRYLTVKQGLIYLDCKFVNKEDTMFVLTRLATLCSALAALFGMHKAKQEPDVDQILVNAINKSHSDWVARGWAERPR